jgi:DNA mismatch endonuclease (patch repair protein)
MSRIRGKDTKPELMLRSLLHRSGFRFRLHVPELPGKPDIVLPKFGTVIFVHGCFWHRHEGCAHATMPKTRPEFWTDKFRRTVERDAEKQAQLESAGWHVLTVWECELNDDPQQILSRIERQMFELANKTKTALGSSIGI